MPYINFQVKFNNPFGVPYEHRLWRFQGQDPVILILTRENGGDGYTFSASGAVMDNDTRDEEIYINNLEPDSRLGVPLKYGLYILSDAPNSLAKEYHLMQDLIAEDRRNRAEFRRKLRLGLVQMFTKLKGKVEHIIAGKRKHWKVPVAQIHKQSLDDDGRLSVSLKYAFYILSDASKTLKKEYPLLRRMIAEDNRNREVFRRKLRLGLVQMFKWLISKVEETIETKRARWKVGKLRVTIPLQWDLRFEEQYRSILAESFCTLREREHWCKLKDRDWNDIPRRKKQLIGIDLGCSGSRITVVCPILRQYDDPHNTLVRAIPPSKRFNNTPWGWQDFPAHGYPFDDDAPAYMTSVSDGASLSPYR
ncbi:hypothetical protein B0H65DRAFT_445179 [Neurospora tetraspora]|uniref:Uncharacterized protein n=1 Tax=Neurospora tetraspora TaxID=94610 RepID=A0AAE0J8K1_9PEZI|nr:hypothetical protein B0H65DRAFT_445179 [Neurospora tetraspora]